MELDITPKENKKHAILRYILHHEPKTDVNLIRTDGVYTNIAYDNVDINRKYRMVFGVSTGPNVPVKWCELLPGT